MDWKVPTPARIEIIGPSQAGKSTLVLKLIQDDSVWCGGGFQKVIYAVPTLQGREEYLAALDRACSGDGEERRKELLVLDRVPNVEEDVVPFSEGHQVLLVLDDLLGFRDTKGLQDLVTIQSHHNRISCIFCVQNPFLKSSSRLDLTTVSRNLTGRFLMYQVNDWSIFGTLNSRLFPDRKNFLLECLTYARDKLGLPYIFINTASFNKLERRYIVYTAMFQEERRQFEDSPFFFDLNATRS